MYIRHRNRRLRVSEISSNTDQNDASFLMNDAVTGVEANIVQAKSLYRSRAGHTPCLGMSYYVNFLGGIGSNGFHIK